MSFFRKLARRKAAPAVPGPSSQESAANLTISQDSATNEPSTGLPSTDGQKFTAQTAHRAPDRSGHRYDGVELGGESRSHLGDVYNRHVTYNYGAPFLPSESTEKQRESDDSKRKEAARLEAERRLQDEKRLANEHQQLEFLQALQFDVMDSRQATVGLAHTNTCAWIVEAPEYVRWRDESYLPEHHGVLWIKGNPGCGKSTLMKYALNLAQDRGDGDVIASFLFNARGQFLEKSAEGMYRSLLHQLLRKLPHLYSSQTHIKQQTWSIELLENVLQTSVLALKPAEHVVLYIDALDECVQDEIRDVVGRFEDLVDIAVTRGLRFSICFSSRHYPHITMNKFEELRLDNRDGHLEDISIYVHSHVGRLRVPPTAKTKIEAEINRRSSGVFLWAALVIKILREKCDDGATQSELMNSLATVPDKLASLFASILTNPDQATITAFQWIFYARNPPLIQELYFAIKTSTNQLSTGEWDKNDVDQESIKRFITRTTRGLVQVVEHPLGGDECIIQFVHESVREHLLQGGLATLTMCDARLIEGLSHAHIARCCLSYVLLDPSKYSQYFQPHQGLLLFLSEKFPLHAFTTNDLVYHADLAYRAGVLSLTFVSELPLRLLICISNAMMETENVVETTTVLFWLIIKGGYALAEALLAGCSMTEKPGIVSYGTIAQSAMTLDINMGCDGWDGGVLGAAAASGKIDLVQQLLHLDAEVVPSVGNVCSPLIPAIRSGSKDVVELLLQHGADVNAVSTPSVLSKKPETALTIAVRMRHHEVASVLLAYHPDLHHRLEYGTALDCALSLSDTEMIRLLWNAHFPESEWSRTLLTCASKTGEHWHDTVTVHEIEYYTGDGGDNGYETDRDDISIDTFVSYGNNRSGKSVISVKTNRRYEHFKPALVYDDIFGLMARTLAPAVGSWI